MKKIVLFISLILLITIGCQKEESLSLFDDSPILHDVTTKVEGLSLHAMKPLKMVPLKGEVVEVGEGELLSCFGIPYFSRYLDIGGEVTHLGNVAGGYVDILNCRQELRDGIPAVVTDVSGQFKAANDDLLYYSGELVVKFIDGQPPVVTNFNIINGGTGRWENANGYFDTAFENLENGNLVVTVSGEVSPPGNNKK